MGAISSIYLLLKAGANPNSPSRDYIFTPLIRASAEFMAGKEVFQLLIDAGANINATNKFDNTALMTAVFVNGSSSACNREDAIEVLKVTGASEEGLKEVALLLASRKGDVREIQHLMKSGANVNTRSYSGDTPLVLAAAKGHTDIVKALIEAGADVNLGSDWTPLITAVMHKWTDIVKILLDSGADVDVSTTDGKTVKMYVKPLRSHPISNLIRQAKAK